MSRPVVFVSSSAQLSVVLVFRRALVAGIAFRSHRFPLLVSSGVPLSVPFRSVPSLALFFVSFLFLVSFSCRVVGRRAVFLSSFSRVVLSCRGVRFPGRCCPPSRFVVSWGRAVSPVVLPVDPFGVSGFLRLVRSSRVIRLAGRLVSSDCDRCVVRIALPWPLPHRAGASMSRSAVGIGGRLAVACFVLTHAVRSLGAVFPSSVYRHGVAWIVPVPVAAWRGHPRPPCVLATASSPCVPRHIVSAFRLSVRSSARFVSPVGCPVSLVVPVRHQPRRGRASRSHGVFALPYPHAPFFPAQFSICFPLCSSRGDVRANRLTGHRGRVVSYGTSRGTQ